MILDDFCLLPAWFCCVIIHVRNLESHMHIADRCAPRKISDGAEKPYFAGAAISLSEILPQIPADRVKSSNFSISSRSVLRSTQTPGASFSGDKAAGAWSWPLTSN
jgi:hypothetical protein